MDPNLKSGVLMSSDVTIMLWSVAVQDHFSFGIFISDVKQAQISAICKHICETLKEKLKQDVAALYWSGRYR